LTSQYLRLRARKHAARNTLDPPMKKLVFETPPVPGNCRAWCRIGRLFEKEGPHHRIGGSRRGRGGVFFFRPRTPRHRREGTPSLRQSRHPVFESGQGRHVYFVRVGHSTAGRRQNRRHPHRPPRHRHLTGPSWCAGFSRLHAPQLSRDHAASECPFYAGTPYPWRCYAGRFPAARPIQDLSAPPCSRKLFKPYDEGRDEATTLTEPYSVGRGRRLPHDLLAFYFGTEVASDRIDRIPRGFQPRGGARRCRRINADKQVSPLLRRYHNQDPGDRHIEAPRSAASPHRGCVDPARPAVVLQRHLLLWSRLGMLEKPNRLSLVNMDVHTRPILRRSMPRPFFCPSKPVNTRAPLGARTPLTRSSLRKQGPIRRVPFAVIVRTRIAAEYGSGSSPYDGGVCRS